jgi:hypothetical protein
MCEFLPHIGLPKRICLCAGENDGRVRTDFPHLASMKEVTDGPLHLVRDEDKLFMPSVFQRPCAQPMNTFDCFINNLNVNSTDFRHSRTFEETRRIGHVMPVGVGVGVGIGMEEMPPPSLPDP